jgi:hypothetical protein
VTASEKSARSPDATCVHHYVNALNKAGTDRSIFDTVHAELKHDKAVLKEEADAIAHHFTGARKEWPTRSNALTAIKNRFDHKA